MSQNSIRLANDHRLASEQRTRDGVLVDYQEVAISHLGAQPLPLLKYFKNSSSVEMAVDGTTPVSFDVAPADAEIYRIEKLVLVASLASSPTLSEFGDIAALSNGLSLGVYDSDEALIVDLLGGEAIKNNDDLAVIGSIEAITLGATYSLRCEILLGSPVRLEAADSEKIRITVSDDLQAITRLRCTAIGRLETTLS